MKQRYPWSASKHNSITAWLHGQYVHKTKKEVATTKSHIVHMHLHKMHTPPPVWLIYLRPWRDFRKFHYDPHSSQCSRPDWGHSPLQSLSPLSVHMHTHRVWDSVTDTLLLSILISYPWQRYSPSFKHKHTHAKLVDSKGDFFTVPNQSGGRKLIKPNHRTQFTHLLLFTFPKPYL